MYRGSGLGIDLADTGDTSLGPRRRSRASVVKPSTRAILRHAARSQRPSRSRPWSVRGVGSIYDTDAYPEGVPNPYTPRVHAWGDDTWLAHGTRYHGPNYTRPMFEKRWEGRPLMGLGQTERESSMQVNTRGGVFSPSGYGGGVFNQNVAFGAIESSAKPLGPAAMPHPLAGGTWGAIPWVCWGGASGLPENTEFRNCIAKIQNRMPGAGLTDPALLAAAQAECSGVCNQLDAETQVYGGSYSADTANLQSRINAHVHASRAQDPTFQYCPVDVDGKLGPQTCTASKILFGQWPDMCDAIGFNSPWKDEDCAGGHDVAPTPDVTTSAPTPAVTVEPPAAVPRKAGISSASMLVGGVVALGALGALVWYGSEQGWFSS